MSNFIYNLNGDLLVFESNKRGQLGSMHTKNINISTILTNDKNIINIICGAYHTIIHKQHK